MILAEYPGYGPRDGKPDEESLVADAQATIELAHRLYGAPVLLIVESLGAGVVAAAGSRERDSIVPARFGEALHNALNSPKQPKIVAAAEHNDWIGRVDNSWWQQAIGFLLAASQ